MRIPTAILPFESGCWRGRATSIEWPPSFVECLLSTTASGRKGSRLCENVGQFRIGGLSDLSASRKNRLQRDLSAQHLCAHIIVAFSHDLGRGRPLACPARTGHHVTLLIDRGEQVLGLIKWTTRKRVNYLRTETIGAFQRVTSLPLHCLPLPQRCCGATMVFLN
jgi:hypothetical protein